MVLLSSALATVYPEPCAEFISVFDSGLVLSFCNQPAGKASSIQQGNHASYLSPFCLDAFTFSLERKSNKKFKRVRCGIVLYAMPLLTNSRLLHFFIGTI
jgi:hypothetical protein